MKRFAQTVKKVSAGPPPALRRSLSETAAPGRPAPRNIAHSRRHWPAHRPVAERITRDVVAERHHLAGDFEAEDGAGIGRRRIVALALEHVRPVDAGGRDAHEDLAVLRLRRAAFHHHEIVGAAMLAEPDIGHGWGK
ncbi:hypothetical protein GCM10023069_00080 [Shinella granuli]